MMRWETAACEAQTTRHLLKSPLRFMPPVRMQTEYSVQSGEWTPTKYRLLTSYPFFMECEVPGPLAAAAARADGRKTGLDLCRELIAEEMLHPQTPPEEFARALFPLISGGMIEVEGYRLPQSARFANV